MKTLFDKNETFSEAATELDSRAGKLLTPLLNEFLARGYTAREIENVLLETVFEIALIARMDKKDSLEGEGPDGFGRKS